MAATIITRPEAKKASLYRVLQKDAVRRATRGLRPSGARFLERSFPIAASSVDEVGDGVYLVQFPDRCRLLGFEVEAGALDAGPTPALVLAFSLTDGTAETPLIAASPIGQRGGFQGPDANMGAFGINCGGLYFAVKTTTPAAIPQAGTVTVRALIYVNDPITEW